MLVPAAVSGAMPRAQTEWVLFLEDLVGMAAMLEPAVSSECAHDVARQLAALRGR